MEPQHRTVAVLFRAQGNFYASQCCLLTVRYSLHLLILVFNNQSIFHFFITIIIIQQNNALWGEKRLEVIDLAEYSGYLKFVLLIQI